MDTSKIIKETTESLGIKEVLPEVYRDLLKPTAVEVGKQLVVVGKTVGVALSPLKLMVWGYENTECFLKAKLTQKLSKVCKDDIVTPDPTIAGPLVMAMSFSKDENELREMYANLLANNMNVNTRSLTHPSFVSIIQQLTSEEAQLLKKIADNYEEHEIIAWDIWVDGRNLVLENNPSWGDKFDEWKIDKTNGYRMVDNFLRLRILSDNYQSGSKYVDKNFEKYAEGSPAIQNSEEKIFFISDFGAAFLRVCVSD